ncbi:putative non-classical export protein Nce2 [Patellaria atrata CBS 101060]|uniref:Non-classical export protein Nce2 n=1 Tax=Patellaria atrata CBS 101060 TaxID=1346257 RepID=A0A9P4VSQ3_9PEZI|nr:putative non-classical export protein Nce2 [Patellaria atrata CBS 101060]
MVSQALNLGLRGLQFLWTLLIMALVGNMIATSYAGDPSIVNYTMFVSVFAMLSLFYLIPTTLKPDFSFHPALTVALDAINTLLFLCGAIALAAYLGVHSCNNRSYTLTNLVTNGSVDTEKRCREAQASTAFLWFGFAAFAASLFFSIVSSRGSVNMRGGIRRGGPSMSQV